LQRLGDFRPEPEHLGRHDHNQIHPVGASDGRDHDPRLKGGIPKAIHEVGGSFTSRVLYDTATVLTSIPTPYPSSMIERRKAFARTDVTWPVDIS
jgi:hypothetical protein